VTGRGWPLSGSPDEKKIKKDGIVTVPSFFLGKSAQVAEYRPSSPDPGEKPPKLSTFIHRFAGLHAVAAADSALCDSELVTPS
jgi:hypothetical protein